jgi:hypothetical protein
LGFIQEVAAAGFPREAVSMLTGIRLAHLLKYVERNRRTEAWMWEMDSAMAIWLQCLTAFLDLENVLDSTNKDLLTK